MAIFNDALARQLKDFKVAPKAQVADFSDVNDALVGGTFAGNYTWVTPDQEPRKSVKFFSTPQVAVLNELPTFTAWNVDVATEAPVASVTTHTNNQYTASYRITPSAAITSSTATAYTHAQTYIYNNITRAVADTTGVDWGSVTATTDSSSIIWNTSTDYAGGYTITGTGYWSEVTTDASGTISFTTAVTDIKEQIKEMIRSNLLIRMGRSRQALRHADAKELKARDTLRDMLTEKDWRRYVTNGFIMVKGSSDFSWDGVRGPYWYQVFNDKQRVLVYHGGKHVHSICIHTDQICPPSDHVINIKVLAELDEAQVWAGGNVTSGELARWRSNGLVLGSNSEQALIEKVKAMRSGGVSLAGSLVSGTLAC